MRSSRFVAHDGRISPQSQRAGCGALARPRSGRDDDVPMAKHFLHAICVATCVSAAAPAVAVTPRDLAGWWLAIDGVVPSEEFLVQ